MVFTGDFIPRFQATCSLVEQIQVLLASFAHSDNLMITCFMFTHSCGASNVQRELVTFAIQTFFLTLIAELLKGEFNINDWSHRHSFLEKTLGKNQNMPLF